MQVDLGDLNTLTMGPSVTKSNVSANNDLIGLLPVNATLPFQQIQAKTDASARPYTNMMGPFTIKQPVMGPIAAPVAGARALAQK